MNISPIQANLVNTNFGCNDPACKGCNCQSATMMPQQPKQDTVEITGKKVKEAVKKGANFVKENKTGVKQFAKSAFLGIATACTVLTANDGIQKMTGSNTTPLARKCALFAAVVVTATDLIKNRKAFDKTETNQK